MDTSYFESFGNQREKYVSQFYKVGYLTPIVQAVLTPIPTTTSGFFVIVKCTGSNGNVITSGFHTGNLSKRGIQN